MKARYRLVEHVPVWVAAPLRVNLEGDTKPGFLCVHELENGSGLCGGNVFDLADADGSHSCVMPVGPYFRRHCYDKPRRCPGWAGGGWKYPKVSRCPSGMLDFYIDPSWRAQWRSYRCTKCGVRTIPYVTRWLDWTYLGFRFMRFLGAVKDRWEERRWR